MGQRRNSLEAIQEAFCDAFQPKDLQQLVSYRLPRLAGRVAWDASQEDVVFKLLTEARREGSLDQLVAAAREARPGNAKLAKLLPTREAEERYLEWLVGEVERKARLYSPLQGIGEKRIANRLLAAWEDDPGLAVLQHSSLHREVEEYDDILGAFDKVERAVVLGDPGAGKSTTLRKLALELARRAQKDEEAPLPLLADLGRWWGDEGLWEFLKACAPEIGCAVEALVREGRVVLLLDGLNEMPTAKRDVKAAEVKQLRERPLFVSCRREDYAGELDLKLDTLTLKPLSPQRIQCALRLWVKTNDEPEALANQIFWELAGDARLGEVFEKWVKAGLPVEMFWWVSDLVKWWDHLEYDDYALWQKHLPNPRSLLRLAENPFLLTMLFQVRVSEGGFPMNRGELFSRFIYRLLIREKLYLREDGIGEWRLTEDGEQLLHGLGQLAFRMQRENSRRVLTEAPSKVVEETLGGERFVKKALDSTIIEEDGEIRFRHQLLQEYFGARALQEQIGNVPATELWPREKWWERSGWEETAVLLAGMYADDCSPIVNWLKYAQPEVAAQCILDCGAEIADHEGLMRELQTAWLPRLTDIEREPAPEGRAAIGRALGRLGLDNRKGVGLRSDGVPDIDWVEIPGGAFIYQEGEHRQVETFWMARYPVTNSQYHVFVTAEDGFRNETWWQGLTSPNRTLASPMWNEANHPRERVSWFEAMAFCGWLSEKLGYEVRLPTEWEWERAARSTEGRVYPWKPNGYLAGFANVDETTHDDGPHYLARTSTVGIYPQGASEDGVQDLSGNTWEWCLNEDEEPDRTQRSGTEPRVLRGGSWASNSVSSSAVVRHFSFPSARNRLVGFRVVSSFPNR